MVSTDRNICKNTYGNKKNYNEIGKDVAKILDKVTFLGNCDKFIPLSPEKGFLLLIVRFTKEDYAVYSTKGAGTRVKNISLDL